MSHKNRKNLHGVASDLKGRLLLVTLVLTGFVAQLAIIGPTDLPEAVGRDDAEETSAQTVSELPENENKKIKPLKVVPQLSGSSQNSSSSPQGSELSPSLQGGPKSTSSSKASATSSSNDKAPPQTEKPRNCRLLNLLFCD